MKYLKRSLFVVSIFLLCYCSGAIDGGGDGGGGDGGGGDDPTPPETSYKLYDQNRFLGYIFSVVANPDGEYVLSIYSDREKPYFTQVNWEGIYESPYPSLFLDNPHNFSSDKFYISYDSYKDQGLSKYNLFFKIHLDDGKQYYIYGSKTPQTTSDLYTFTKDKTHPAKDSSYFLINSTGSKVSNFTKELLLTQDKVEAEKISGFPDTIDPPLAIYSNTGQKLHTLTTYNHDKNYLSHLGIQLRL